MMHFYSQNADNWQKTNTISTVIKNMSIPWETYVRDPSAKLLSPLVDSWPSIPAPPTTTALSKSLINHSIDSSAHTPLIAMDRLGNKSQFRVWLWADWWHWIVNQCSRYFTACSGRICNEDGNCRLRRYNLSGCSACAATIRSCEAMQIPQAHIIGCWCYRTLQQLNTLTHWT